MFVLCSVIRIVSSTCVAFVVSILHCFCSNRVRLAATNALLNSLEFTRANFDVEVSISYYLVIHLNI